MSDQEQRQFWAEDCSFGDYMIAADEYLKALIGRGKTQIELDYLADLQESDCTPKEAAWVIARESFFEPWNYACDQINFLYVEGVIDN